MSVWADVRIGARTSVGRIEITRHTNRDMLAPSPDTVSVYRVAIDGQAIGEVTHRYGDGAWALLARAAGLAAS